jgi:hypothetical protein
MLAPCSAAPVSSQPQDRPGARRPEQARGDADQKRSAGTRPVIAHRRPLTADYRQPPAAVSADRPHAAAPVSARTERRTVNASQRPYWLSCTTQPPPTAANVATSANVIAIPASRGKPLRMNGCPVRAKTKGRTGRMHGLTIVSTPPEISENQKPHNCRTCRK